MKKKEEQQVAETAALKASQEERLLKDVDKEEMSEIASRVGN